MLTRSINSGSVAEVFVDERHRLVAKVAFSESSISVLRQEAHIMGSYLLSCPSVPKCYGLFEAPGIALLLMDYAGEEFDWGELSNVEK